MLKNTDERYGAIAKIFHWVIGLTIIGMIFFGWYMSDLDSSSSNRYELYTLHKSIGITVLLLAFLRVAWRFTHVIPHSIPSHKKWEKMLAKTAHFLLYCFMFLLPLSGWAMSSAGGHAVFLWGLEIPPLVSESKDIGKIASSVHSLAAWGVLVTAAIHMLGALKHHFLDKDATLKRMLPFYK